MSNENVTRGWGATSPATKFEAIILGTPFSTPARGIYVGADGNINIVGLDGTAVVFVGARAGSVIPVGCTAVNTASTTASNLIALI